MLVLWGGRKSDVQVGSREDRERRRHQRAFRQLALALRAGRIAHEFELSLEQTAYALSMDTDRMEALRRQILGLKMAG